MAKSKKGQKYTRQSGGPPSFDRRIMERVQADMHAAVEAAGLSSPEEAQAILARYMGPDAEEIPHRVSERPLDKAQDLMYEAFEARGKKRVELARQALSVCADCADAYVLLAEEEAKSTEEARDLFAQGVAAGERSLDPELREQLAGELWMSLEARPYMRALDGLAQTQWELGEREQAVEIVLRMLDLNEGDNQGVRVWAVLWLLELGRSEQAESVLKRYRNDQMLEMVWARAIWTFHARGPGQVARRRLREAFTRNLHVMALLIGVDKGPTHLADSYTLGSPEEAHFTVAALMPLLLESPGLGDWVMDEMMLFGQEGFPGAQPDHGRPGEEPRPYGKR